MNDFKSLRDLKPRSYTAGKSSAFPRSGIANIGKRRVRRRPDRRLPCPVRSPAVGPQIWRHHASRPYPPFRPARQDHFRRRGGPADRGRHDRRHERIHPRGRLQVGARGAGPAGGARAAVDHADHRRLAGPRHRQDAGAGQCAGAPHAVPGRHHAATQDQPGRDRLHRPTSFGNRRTAARRPYRARRRGHHRSRRHHRKRRHRAHHVRGQFGVLRLAGQAHHHRAERRRAGRHRRAARHLCAAGSSRARTHRSDGGGPAHRQALHRSGSFPDRGHRCHREAGQPVQCLAAGR